LVGGSGIFDIAGYAKSRPQKTLGFGRRKILQAYPGPLENLEDAGGQRPPAFFTRSGKGEDGKFLRFYRKASEKRKVFSLAFRTNEAPWFFFEAIDGGLLRRRTWPAFCLNFA
jgi:hypothetical protein